MFLITDNLVNGSTIKLLMDSNGKNCVIELAVSLFGNILNVKIPFAIPSMIFQTNRKPIAKADLFIKTPKNKQKEKNPTSLIK
jgi:hypothetical protein